MVMNTEHAGQPMLVGHALKSTVLIMGELGSIGSDVLKARNVFDIDVDAWYPTAPKRGKVTVLHTRSEAQY